MLNIEQETQALLEAYREHTKILLKEVHDRGEIIKRLLDEIEDMRTVNALLG